MPDAEASNGTNQRVTNALLRSDIQHLTGVVEGGFAELKARDADHEKRLREVETKTTTLAAHDTQGNIFTGVAAFGAMLAGIFVQRP